MTEAQQTSGAEPNYPICEGVTVKLTGENGNAYVILAKVVRAMKRAGIPEETIQQYEEEAKSGDYDNLLAVTMKYVDVG